MNDENHQSFPTIRPAASISTLARPDSRRSLRGVLRSLASQSFTGGGATATASSCVASLCASKPPSASGTLDVSGWSVATHEMLGRGGAASVFVGSARGVAFAVKSIDLRGADAQGRARAAREAAIAERCGELPNCLAFLGAKQVRPETLLLFFELAACSLRDVLDERALAERELLDVAAQLSVAVAALHRAHVAHLDLKADNVFVQWRDDARTSPRIKLGDFGEAVAANKDLVQRGCGTTHFRAPEAHNERVFDPLKADIWSFGMLLFELATRVVPFYTADGKAPPPFAVSHLVAAGVRPAPPAVRLPANHNLVLSMHRKLTVVQPSRRPSASKVYRTAIKLRDDQQK